MGPGLVDAKNRVAPPMVTPETQHKPHLVTGGAVEDGVEWDTGAIAAGTDYEKPNVQMFLPLLRVLGKGSFGKVSLGYWVDSVMLIH